MDLYSMMPIVIDIIGEAAGKVLEIYRTDFSEGIHWKEDNSPLTAADTSANRIILARLGKAYPNIPILSEESIPDRNPFKQEYCWVVDPLDGTKEFIHKRDEFTVNIGLVRNGRPVLGAVAIPVTGDIYYALKDGGAFKLSQGTAEKIRVSSRTQDLIFVGSKSHSSRKESDFIAANRQHISKIMAAGSSLKGLMVAEGRADIYYRFGYTCEWDTCAMHCIAEEAGGILRQMDGSELTYNRENHLNERGFYIVNCAENIFL